MNRDSKFEEIQFRWPVKNDQLFVSAPGDNSHIETNYWVRTYQIIEGYKGAAELLVGQTEDDPSLRDLLVFPIIFNYRHFIELSLKNLLNTYGTVVGIKRNWKDHDLRKLWREFESMSEKYSGHIDETTREVGKLILEFSIVDPNSFSYRYPVDTQGMLIPIEFTEIHLPTLADVMNGLSNYFTGCDGYFDNLSNAGP